MGLNNLFNPKSIAIVGASEEAGKVGNVIAKNILELGYQGEVFLVNPKHETLFGRKCHKSLSEIESAVDLAIIVIPAKFVNDAIRGAKDKVKNYAVISAGFGEIHPVKSADSGLRQGGVFNGVNEEGPARQEELRKIAEENNLNILGPNCLGFIIPQLKLNASFAGGMPETGNIAFVSQSGALAVAMMDMAKKENLKFSSVISIGNKMQLDETELLEYLDNDNDTKVIGMYLEGIKNGQKFIAAAQKIKKPIIVLKAGKTEKAQKAISSHTGALAGSDEIMSAIFAKTGIIRARDIEEFLSLLGLISAAEAPRNEDVIIVTNAGGLGVLTTDAFQDKKIKLAEISEKAQAAIRKFLPEESSVANPIDVLGDADEKRYAKTFDLLKKENADTILCLLTPQDQTPVKKIAKKIIKFKEKTGKNMVTVFMGGKRVEKAVEKLKENNIPNYFLADQAVSALDKYYQWSLARVAVSPLHRSGETAMENIERKNKALGIIAKAKAGGRGALLFSEAEEIMKLYGINTVKTFNENSADIVFPVVVKVDSDKVLHKTDKQGVILNIKNKEELAAAVAKMKNNFPGENFIIQPMLERQTELIIGIKKDRIFGPVIVYGLGGIYTEIFKIAEFLISPLDVVEIKKSLAEGKLSFMFRETRGQKAYNMEEISQILLNIGRLAEEIGEIKEFDINPLLVYNNGREAVAVDVKILSA